jgi:hypothetical protein
VLLEMNRAMAGRVTRGGDDLGLAGHVEDVTVGERLRALNLRRLGASPANHLEDEPVGRLTPEIGPELLERVAVDTLTLACAQRRLVASVDEHARPG